MANELTKNYSTSSDKDKLNNDLSENELAKIFIKERNSIDTNRRDKKSINKNKNGS